MSNYDIFLRLSLILFLILLNAFFVTAEFSIVSVRRSRIIQLVESGDILAKTVQSLQRSLERLLSTTQLGITLSSLALGWIGESTMAIIVKNFILHLPLTTRSANIYSHALSIPIAFFIIAYLQIVLGELCPKSVALIYSEKLAKILAAPIGVIAQVFNPFIWILNQSTRFLLGLIGIHPTDTRWHNRVTSEELQLIISTEGETTGLKDDEREILNNLFEFKEVTVGEIMVPRTQITAISEKAIFKNLLQDISETGHFRYPIKGDSLDDIRGMIDFKDLTLPLAQGKITSDTPLQSWIKPVHFFPESTPLSELLSLMQRSKVRMVMIVDEFGGTSGLVTLQDLIAEILGNNLDQSNFETIELQMLDDQTYLVQAQMDLEEVNEILALNLPVTDEYQTLGGFLLHQLQKLPSQGETYNYDDIEFTIIAAEGPRLSQIQIHRHGSGNGNLIKDINLSTSGVEDDVKSA